MVGAPAQEFSPSWTARKRVQEKVKFQENPGNLYFQKTAENRRGHQAGLESPKNKPSQAGLAEVEKGASSASAARVKISQLV